jgi:hypothetical protein
MKTDLEIRLSLHWKVLQIGSGASRPGFVDALLCLDSQGRPAINGNSAKGLLRGIAEPWVRSIAEQSGSGLSQEKNDSSIPPPGILRRLFAGNERGPWWRGIEPRIREHEGGAVVRGQTRIDPGTRTAVKNSLRSREVWQGSVVYEFGVMGLGLDLAKNSSDWWDALFWMVVMLSADYVGGGSGTGAGWVQAVSNLRLEPDCPSLRKAVVDEEAIKKLIERIGVAA